VDGPVQTAEAATIDAEGLHYSSLNRSVRAALAAGARDLRLNNVRGQRYIGTALPSPARLAVYGTPGNDLGAFLDGGDIRVYGNAQSGAGNTMSAGRIVVHGDAADAAAYSMRGGVLLVRGSVGYRVAVHLKAGADGRGPTVVIGGNAGDYLGEYMAGGRVAILNLQGEHERGIGRHLASGMHGGVIYLRCRPDPAWIGANAQVMDLEPADRAELRGFIEEYAREFGMGGSRPGPEEFVKVVPATARPYGRLYAG
jgi:glutamate synthase domain-containing protein 3